MNELPVNFNSFVEFIEERETIRILKDTGAPKPWSEDPTFQTTYFCNVNRENDKVTEWIRKFYNRHVADPLFVHNIAIARFLNYPETLEFLGYQLTLNYTEINHRLKKKAKDGKIWGSAYVVTTHGLKMGKIDYFTYHVLPSLMENVGGSEHDRYCQQRARNLQLVEGVSTFMAGQIIADLKNTPGHRLQTADDWWTFVLPGPGSRRGMDWVAGEKVAPGEWTKQVLMLRNALQDRGIELCAQNVQNCLCEYDKYCRVSTGAGRSKRRYDGTSDNGAQRP